MSGGFGAPTLSGNATTAPGMLDNSNNVEAPRLSYQDQPQQVANRQYAMQKNRQTDALNMAGATARAAPVQQSAPKPIQVTEQHLRAMYGAIASRNNNDPDATAREFDETAARWNAHGPTLRKMWSGGNWNDQQQMGTPPQTEFKVGEDVHPGTPGIPITMLGPNRSAPISAASERNARSMATSAPNISNEYGGNATGTSPYSVPMVGGTAPYTTPRMGPQPGYTPIHDEQVLAPTPRMASAPSTTPSMSDRQAPVLNAIRDQAQSNFQMMSSPEAVSRNTQNEQGRRDAAVDTRQQMLDPTPQQVFGLTEQAVNQPALAGQARAQGQQMIAADKNQTARDIAQGRNDTAVKVGEGRDKARGGGAGQSAGMSTAQRMAWWHNQFAKESAVQIPNETYDQKDPNKGAKTRPRYPWEVNDAVKAAWEEAMKTTGDQQQAGAAPTSQPTLPTPGQQQPGQVNSFGGGGTPQMQVFQGFKYQLGADGQYHKVGPA